MINERGCWGREEAETRHVFDAPLCVAIADICRGNTTVLDVGCGVGSYTKRLIEEGYNAVGFDGCLDTKEISGGVCGVMDFSEPVEVGKYDVVLCLEVGEHIPKEYEGVFINNLCNATNNMLILSWAVPGQEGDGHVNCLDNYYVIKAISDKGFVYCHNISTALRDAASLPWFTNTIMVFKCKQ
jgi:cyclopropane fatty-acyl-phospholipid synthase-like methyltransferase